MSVDKRKALLGILAAVIIANAVVLGLRRGFSKNDDLLRMIPVEPLEYRSRLVENLNQESLTATADRLPQFDDTVWVMGNGIEHDTACSQRSYRFQSTFIPRLNRVRKVIEQYRSGDPGAKALAAQLESHFAWAVDQFDRALRSKTQQVLTAPHGFVCSEPDDYWSCVVYAPGSAYLLSEMGITDALPQFSKALSLSGELPVNRVFLFFAAHQLMKLYPRESLSATSRHLLDEYLELTRDVPVAEQRVVCSWEAPYEEDDVRFILLHRDVSELDSSHREMSFFPTSLMTLDRTDGSIDPKLQEYQESLKRFVTSMRVD